MPARFPHSPPSKHRAVDGRALVETLSGAAGRRSSLSTSVALDPRMMDGLPTPSERRLGGYPRSCVNGSLQAARRLCRKVPPSIARMSPRPTSRSVEPATAWTAPGGSVPHRTGLLPRHPTIGVMLGSRVFEPVLASVAVPVLGGDSVGCEPVRALPAGSFSEACTACGQPVVNGRTADPSGRLWLTVWPVHRVEEAECFDGAIVEVGAVSLERHHAAHVDIPQVHRRMPVDDPVREHLAGPARGLDADRVESRGDEHPGDIGRLPEEVSVIS